MACALVGRALGAGMASSMISNATSGPSTSSASQRARMQLAEPAGDVLRAELQRRASGRDAGTPGRRGRSARRWRSRRARRAARARRPWRRRRRPLPPPLQCRPSPCRLAMPRRSAAAAMRWSFSPSPRKIWPTSNSATSLQAAPRVALGGRGEAGDQARAHVGEIGGDRIGERQRGRAAAEQFGLRLGDERPGHRLAEARARRARAWRGGCASAAASAPACGTPVVEPRQRRRRHAVEPGDAHDLLDDVGLAVDVGAPVGHDRLAAVDFEAEPARGSPRPRLREFRGRSGA